MKFKDIFPMLGFKSRDRRYGYHVKTFDVEGVGECRYAQWLHPLESKKKVSAAHVLEYRKIIKPGDFCIDIGARSGDTTLPMAIAAGPEGETLAIEPNPYVFHVLEKNARANRKIANIIPIMGAAADSEEFINFKYYDPGYFNGGQHKNVNRFSHGHAYALKVFTFNLARELRNDFESMLPRLKFIKTDCEGYDLEVLKSLKDIIQEFKPYIKCEVFKKTPRNYKTELVTFLTDMGYRTCRISREPIITAEEVTVENCRQWRHYDLFCRPRE